METEEGWWGFIKLCQRTNDAKQLDELLRLFLTLEERRALALRVSLVKALLEREKTQREIAADLHVSIAKITRGSNALKTTSRDLKEALTSTL